MKRLLTLVAIGTALGTTAQVAYTGIPSMPIGKVTVTGDTLALTNFIASDNSIVYGVGTPPFDSGYFNGYNAYGDMGYAERFDITGADSSVLLLGVAAQISGVATANTTKTFQLFAWKQGAPIRRRPTLITTGYPDVAIDSSLVTLASIRGANGGIDQVVTRGFQTPQILTDSFF
jgi:hypothetical protein